MRNYYRRESVPFLDQKEPRWRNCEEIATNYEEHRELMSPNADLRYGTARTYWCWWAAEVRRRLLVKTG